MPLPTDLTVIQVTDTYVDMAGNPVGGSVSFVPTSQLTDDTGNVVFPQQPVVVGVSKSTGTFTVKLPCTDNSGLAPSSWAYTVEISVQGMDPTPFNVLLPSTLGSSVQLRTVAPAVPPAPPLGTAVYSVNGQSGAVEITAASLGAISSSALTAETARAEAAEAALAASVPSGSAPVPIGSGGTNSTSAGAALTALGAASATALTAETARAEAAEALKAPLASPALTGSPTAPTQTTGDSTTKIATDAFVATAAAAAQAAAIAASLPALTANVSVSSGGTLALNTVTEVSAGSNLTMTLPSSTAGDVIVCEKSDSSANTVSITGNIRGAGSTTVTLKLQNESTMFLGYAGSWWPVAGHKTLSSLDSRYTQFVNVLAFGADPTGGTDSTSAINAALTVVSASNKGATVFFPAGTYTISGTLTADSSSGVTLLGCGGTTAGAAAGTKMTFSNTGSGALISAVSSLGFRLRGVQVVYSSGSFTGNMLDLRNVSAGDTALFRVDDCLFAASSTASANACIALDKANTGMITGCNFEGAAYGILGRESGASYSNANTVTGCQFVDLVTAGIRNPGQGWLISGNTFENLSGGGAGGILCDSGAGTYGTEIAGNWFGDATVNSGSPISINGGGLAIHGNYIGFITGMTAVAIGNNTIGFRISGNRFDNGGGTGTTAISVGTSCSSYDCTGNGALAGLPSPVTDVNIPAPAGTPQLQGYAAWTYDAVGGGVYSAPGSSTYTAGKYYLAELPISNYALLQTLNGFISFQWFTSGTAGTNCFVGLYGVSGTTATRLGITANLAGTSSATPIRQSMGITSFSAYPQYYVAFVSGTQATSGCGPYMGQQVQFAPAYNAGFSNTSVPSRCMVSVSTGNTTLPTSITLTSSNVTATYHCPWMAID